MSPASNATLVRPFGRLSPTGNPGTLRNPLISLAQTRYDENRIAHSMQAPCFRRRGQTLGKPGHRWQMPFCNRFRKADPVAYPVYREPVEIPYFSDLRYIEALQPSFTQGGDHGEV